MEGVERTNVVVVREQEQEIGCSEEILMQWRWIGEETIMLVEVLGIWSDIVEIREEEEWQREGGWNMREEESRETMYYNSKTLGLVNGKNLV